MLGILKSLDKSLRNKVIFISLISLMVIPLEFLSIAAVIPLFASIFDNTTSNSIIDFSFLEFNFFGENRITNALLLLMFLFLLKNLFLGFFFKKKFNYIFLIQKQISRMIFFNYLSSNYNFYIKNDSATIIRNVINEVSFFTKGYLLSIIDLILESLALITIAVFLIIYDPKTTISLLIFLSLITYIIDRVKKGKIEQIGIKRFNYNKYIIQILSATYKGIKEIKANFLERKMLDEFDKKIFIKLFHEKKMSFLSSIPRLLFELVCIFALSAIVFLNKDSGTNLGEIIAVYTFATFRVMPSFVKLTLILQTMTHAKPSVEVVKDHYLKKQDEIKRNLKKMNEMLAENKNHEKLNSLQIKIDKFKYDQNIIIKNFDLEIKKGEKICIGGKSGSGKTTLIDIITGIVECKNLKFILNGNELKENQFLQKRIFSYIPQNPTIFQTSVQDNITLFDEKIDNEKYKKAIELSRSDFIKDFEERDFKEISENGTNLSGGQIQRIFIARAIYSNKEIIIFDESTNELDFKTENHIVEDILKLPQTVIFITHKEEIKKKFSKIINIENN
tara:strand:- start:8006 stop:9688 length:1683 start_codon:yes stop_codon:yes gene_type:complete